MRRSLGPATRLVLESWGQPPCTAVVHLRGEAWLGVPWQPNILPRAPDLVAQTSGQGWGARGAPVAQACMRQHHVGQADHAPDLPPVPRAAPGQTPGAAPPGRPQPPPGAIPACQAGGLERQATWAPGPRRATTAWATAADAPAARHDRARRVAARDPLGVTPGRWRDPPGLGLTASLPPPPAPIPAPHAVPPCRRRGLPAVGAKQWAWPRARPARRAPRRGRVRRTPAAVDPQAAPPPHGHRGLHPCPRWGTPCGRRFLPWHPLHRAVVHALLGVRLRPWGRHPWAARDGLESPSTHVRRAGGADAPPLPLHPLSDRVGRERAAGPQGARPCRALPVACRPTQSCAGLVRPGPRPRCAGPCAGALAPCTGWMRARASGLSRWRWRRQCHSGPPVVRHGRHETGSTPVMSRYSSPGLPSSLWPKIS